MNNHNQNCCTTPMHRSARDNSAMGCATCREKSDTSCACARPYFPVNTAYAMAYVPFQQSSEVYSPERALARGTIFACLDKPFLKGCCK